MTCGIVHQIVLIEGKALGELFNRLLVIISLVKRTALLFYFMADSKISKSLFRNLALRILVECLPDQGPCLGFLIVIGKASGDPGYDRWIVIKV